MRTARSVKLGSPKYSSARRQYRLMKITMFPGNISPNTVADVQYVLVNIGSY